MIVYRCCACTHDHTTLQIQGMGMNEPTCVRCGLSAFATIHLPDEPAGDVLEGAPPTPRDMPEPDPKRQAEVDALRGVGEVDKAPGLCSQVGCFETATHRFTWPGNPESLACPKHARAAVNVATAMGLFLEVPSL